MFKLKDVFKVAVVGAAGYFGGKIAGSTGSKIGKALGSSLMGGSSGGGGYGSGSESYVPRSINLTQFGMPTYRSLMAQSQMIPGSGRVEDAEQINGRWEARLNKYLLRRKALSEKTVVKV